MTPFDQGFYDDMNSRLAVLKSRALSLDKYPIIVEQIGNLKSQFDTFQQLDKEATRPIKAAIVRDAESAVAISVESILTLELALKRGMPSPPALKTKNQ
jgi:malonyl CoA-acyl carrier protein transacylase